MSSTAYSLLPAYGIAKEITTVRNLFFLSMPKTTIYNLVSKRASRGDHEPFPLNLSSSRKSCFCAMTDWLTDKLAYYTIQNDYCLWKTKTKKNNGKYRRQSTFFLRVTLKGQRSSIVGQQNEAKVTSSLDLQIPQLLNRVKRTVITERWGNLLHSMIFFSVLAPIKTCERKEIRSY